MLLKQAIEEWSALRFMVDDLELFAGNSRKELLHTSFMTDNETLDNLYDQILFWQSRLNDEKSDAQCRKLLDLFSQVVDLEGTIAHLAQKMLLDDVELFELKQIALLSIQINEQLVQLSASKLPNLDGVVALLDPESQKLATFYIYDCYDEELSVLRKTLRARKDDVDVDLLVRTQEIENRIRRELSEQLQPYAGDLLTVLKLVGTIDVLIAKARQSIKWQCVRPRIVESIQSYKALYNPQLKHQLELQSKEIQSIDVELNHSPMLLTGINMGGKTLVLRTLALAQLLTQFGFFVPAESAHVVLVKQVLGSMEDNQDQQHGLSSYAAEMKRIDHILKVSKQIQPCLVLVDELARTTNPTEGRALVSAFLQLMSQRSHFTVLTSHYDGIDARCERWRVKGLKAGADWGIQSLGDAIDYRLVRDDSEHAPQEALKIATLLDVDQELISLAKTLVTK